jgi:hypothetical protein
MARRYALTLVLPLALSCHQRQPASDAAAAAAAEFRFHAKDSYQALNTESCRPDPALRRAVVLAGERRAMRAFEARMASTPLGFQLAIAREDAAYALAAEHGCWDDSDPRFARSHVQMALDQASAGLRRMEEMAPALAASLPEATAPEADQAALRRRFFQLAEAALGPCPLSTRAGNDEILGPARAELRRLRRRLEGTPYALHYDLAESDAAYHWSVYRVSCVDPASGSPADARRDALASIRRSIAEVESKLAR